MESLNEYLKHCQREYSTSSNIKSTDKLLKLVSKSIDIQRQYQQVDFTFILSKLILKLRHCLCPFSISICKPELIEWDRKLSILLNNCLFKFNDCEAVVKRITSQLITTDLEIASSDSLQSSLITNGYIDNLFETYLSICSLGQDAKNTKQALFAFIGGAPLLMNALITMDHPQNWSLLHNLVLTISDDEVISELIRSLVDKGFEITAKSSSGETVLHIASRSCKYRIVPTIIKKALKLTQVKCSKLGYTPLQSLMTTVQISDWKSVISANDLNKLIQILVGPHFHLLWDSNCLSNSELISNKLTSPLYLIIKLNDDSICFNAIKLAMNAPKESWNKSVIKESMISSIVRNRYLILSRLLENFYFFLISKFLNDENIAHFINKGLMLSVQWNSIDCFDVLIEWCKRYGIEVFSTVEFPLLHLCIFKDHSNLRNHNSIRNSGSAESTYDYKFVNRLLNYFSDLLISDLDKMQEIMYRPCKSVGDKNDTDDGKKFVLDDLVHLHSISGYISALSLVCLLSDEDLFQYISKFCKAIGINFNSAFEADTNSLHPINSCIISCSPECLQLIIENISFGESQQFADVVLSEGIFFILLLIYLITFYALCRYH